MNAEELLGVTAHRELLDRASAVIGIGYVTAHKFHWHPLAHDLRR